MERFKRFLPILLTVGGLLLLLMDLMNLNVHMRGSDSIAGAILLGFGVLALTQERK